MKLSFIATFYNEEKTIKVFLQSLFQQTLLPDEIILVDGASSDNTVGIVEKEFKKSHPGIKTLLLVKKGNRSVGRNEAIKNASGEIILSSDAGCILDKNWIKNIQNPFKNRSVDVVAGYYKGIAKSVFQKCLIPFVLVMPDKVNPYNFLPATRTMAFKKSIWKKMGGFDERYSHNEDYVFAHKLKESKAKIVFERKAIVNWIPRTNLKQTFIMFFRFAYGDAESAILRPKVIFLFARYLFAIYFLFLCILYKSPMGFFILLGLLVVYIIWSILKNYKYVKDKKAFLYLPLLQFITDASVLSGTIKAMTRNIQIKYLPKFAKRNVFLLTILGIYTLIMFLVLKWGIPSFSHPFPYHMDEWHQLQAVRATVKFGTPNVAGAANGTMFHFILSALYLAPFTLFNIINPFVIKITDFVMRERIFELLRINTIIYGILSVCVLYKILKSTKLDYKFSLFLFVFNPLWLTLSGYFKYDIALIFWIFLSLLYLFRFYKKPSNINYVLIAIPISIAISVKISALPLIIIYIVGYFFFSESRKRSYQTLTLGIFLSIFLIIILGMPDTLFGKGNILNYLYDNLIHSPQGDLNFKLGMSSYQYLFMYHYPIIFGHGLYFLFLGALFSWIYVLFKEGTCNFYKKYKLETFVILSFLIFTISILPLKIYAAGNRSLVLLPFMIIIVSFTARRFLVNKYKHLIIASIILILSLQISESFVWMNMRITKSPQEKSSEWVIKNISKNNSIGLENIPIYQYVPEIVQKEFYFAQYGVGSSNKYQYKIIDSKSTELPSIVILTNGEIESALFKSSTKKDLLDRLKREHYKKIVSFSPDLRFFKIYGSEKDFYLSGLLIATPVTISIFGKNR